MVVSGLLVMIGFYAVSVAVADEPTRIFICHVTPSGNIELLEVPPQAAAGHFDAAGNPLHAGDHYAINGQCNGPVSTPTPTPGDDPDPTPEPISVLLFGAGVAGVGYVVRKVRGKGQETGE